MHQLPTEVSGVGGRGGARIGKVASPGMKLCNVNWPSDPPIVVPGPDPSNPTAGDTARAAVAGGDWRYAYLLKQGGKVTFTCVLPANAVATGMVADDNDDEIPASLAQSFAAAGIGETFAYNVYTVSA